jgi:tetratricopeptide (TPR) repeat protein
MYWQIWIKRDLFSALVPGATMILRCSLAIVAALMLVPSIRAEDPKAAAAEAIKKAGDAFAKHDWDEALKLISEAIRLDPGNADAWAKRGALHDAKKEWDKAIESTTEAIRLDPKLVKAYINRGQAWMEIGQWEKGIADYNKIQELDSSPHVNHWAYRWVTPPSDAILDKLSLRMGMSLPRFYIHTN